MHIFKLINFLFWNNHKIKLTVYLDFKIKIFRKIHKIFSVQNYSMSACLNKYKIKNCLS